MANERRTLSLAAAFVALIAGMFVAGPALADEVPPQKSYTYCYATHYVHPARSQTMAISNVFESQVQVPPEQLNARSDGYFWLPDKEYDVARVIPKDAGGAALGQEILSKLLNPAAPYEIFHTYCRTFSSEEVANQYHDKDGRNDPNVPDYVVPRTVVLNNWSVEPSSPQSGVKEITYAFQNVSDWRTKQGYRNATIKLRYRFLLCADEVQIAYSLDLKSLDYDPKYYDYSRSGPHNVGTVEAPGTPDVPSSIAIALHITRWPDTSIIATIRDAIAGEALGMGCFTGQTQRVGMLAKLLGPKPTRADVRKYLGELSAAPAFNSLAILDVPLRNSHVILPDDAIGGDPAAARARADAVDNKATAKLNADNAATAAATGRKYVADQEAAARAQAEYEKQKAAKAKYDADMVAYRKRVADDAAEAARKKAAFDARNELYKACVAGDRAACKRYEAGQ